MLKSYYNSSVSETSKLIYTDVTALLLGQTISNCLKSNYQMILWIIKKQLLGYYEEEQIPAIINIAVTEYDKRWKNSKFPSITVGSLCSWIAQEALKISADRKKKVTDRTDKYADLDCEDDEDFEI